MPALKKPVPPQLGDSIVGLVDAIAKEEELLQRLVLQAHEAGASYQSIGDLLGMSDVGAMKMVRRARDRAS